MNLCNIDGCNRAARARNLCQSHYDRFIKHGDATFGGPIRKKATREGTCKIEGCSNKIYAKRMCQKHHRRWIRHDNPNFRLYNVNKGHNCKEESCNQKARSKGYCSKHYAQIYRQLRKTNPSKEKHSI